MEFESQMCTNMEQSERLLALGLKKETADMCWTLRNSDREGNEYSVKYMSIGQGEYHSMHPNWYIPAWSLHRLIEIAGIRAFSPVSSLHGWYDDIIAQIQSLIHIGYIDEKYLDMDVVNKREEKNMELLKNN